MSKEFVCDICLKQSIKLKAEAGQMICPNCQRRKGLTKIELDAEDKPWKYEDGKYCGQCGHFFDIDDVSFDLKNNQMIYARKCPACGSTKKVGGVKNWKGAEN